MGPATKRTFWVVFTSEKERSSDSIYLCAIIKEDYQNVTTKTRKLYLKWFNKNWRLTWIFSVICLGICINSELSIEEFVKCFFLYHRHSICTELQSYSFISFSFCGYPWFKSFSLKCFSNLLQLKMFEYSTRCWTKDLKWYILFSFVARTSTLATD